MSGTTRIVSLAPAAVLLTGIALACGSSKWNPGCSDDANDIPFIEELILPTDLPEDMTLETACYGGEESVATDAEFFYASDNGSLVVVVLTGQGVPVEQNGGSTVQLGDLVGYSSSSSKPDGTTSYGIVFEKDGRSYSVGASLGPTNVVTEDGINAVALSIAEN